MILNFRVIVPTLRVGTPAERPMHTPTRSVGAMVITVALFKMNDHEQIASK